MPEHPWGLISLDWSVNRDEWLKNGRNHTNNEAVSTEGCRRLKAAGKAVRCFICGSDPICLHVLLILEGCTSPADACLAWLHDRILTCSIDHNMELALEWEESQRKVMYDPSKADYFLQYTDGKGNKNGTIYQEDIGPGDQ